MVITGRKAASLAAVQALDERRIVPASAAGSQADIEQALTSALGGKLADIVVDLSGNASTPDSLQVGCKFRLHLYCLPSSDEARSGMQACLTHVKAKGAVVIAGSMTCLLPLDTRPVRRRELEIRGCFMYPRQAAATLLDQQPAASQAVVAATGINLNSRISS